MIPFRYMFIIANIYFVLNLDLVLKIPAANAVEKTLFVLSGITFLVQSKVDYFIITCMALAFFMVFYLAAITNYPDFSWVIFLSALNQIFIIFALLAGRPTEKDRDTIFTVVAFLPILSTALGVVYQAAGFGPAYTVEFATGVSRLVGSLGVAAFLSGLSMCSIFAALQLIMSGRTIFSAIILIDFGILLQSGGRAALAVAVMCCASAIIFSKKIKIITKITMIVTSCVLSGAVLAVFWDKIATRFLNSGDSGRELMWDYLLELASQYPWTGIGFGHQFYSVPREVILLFSSAAAHNDYIRLQLELGYVGVVCFYILLTCAVLRILMRKRMRGDLTMLFAYGGFLFLSRTDNALATPPYFPLVFFAYMASLRFPDKLKPRVGLSPQGMRLNAVPYRQQEPHEV